MRTSGPAAGSTVTGTVLPAAYARPALTCPFLADVSTVRKRYL